MLMVVLLAGQAMAQTAAPKARKARAGGYGTPGAPTGTRISAAINRAALVRMGASRPPVQAERPKPPFTMASRAPWSASALDNHPGLPTLGDRPFDGSTPAANPFAPPDASPGSLWSPPVSLESATNPFKPMASAVNPFQGSLSTAAPLAPKTPGLSVPLSQSYPARTLNAVPTTPAASNSTGILPSPWGNFGGTNVSFLPSPGGLPLNLLPQGSSGNPYSLEDLFRGNSPTSQSSP